MTTKSFTPRETVSELDRFIIGQHKAKRAVAIALRNRWRRQQVAPDLRDEIAPKNIIMIGPTGVGKTEIARRLAKLADAPFIKVEASKFTEVGYVGRDVESMIRDLVESAVRLVKQRELESVEARADKHAYERVAELIVRGRQNKPEKEPDEATANQGVQNLQGPGQLPNMFGPFVVQAINAAKGANESSEPVDEQELARVIEQLRKGELTEETVEVDVTDTNHPLMTVFGGGGGEDMEMNLRDMFSQLPGVQGRSKQRKMPVKDALVVVSKQEAEKLIDTDKVQQKAVETTEQGGIVFLDEVDKIARQSASAGGADVSREGVQRDLLPIIEGSTVNTKYGPVKTDHILFIAAGAFHVSKVADLIPELQGRFPIRVELDSLRREDFERILKEPQSALTKQYQALLKTEGVSLSFKDDAITALASYAAEANERAENIGARRLHTIMEALLDDVSYTAPERRGEDVVVDSEFVHRVLGPIAQDTDTAKYVL